MALYENLKLEKGMYNVSGKNFTSVLEDLDPSENYKGTHLDGLDAFERQLKRFDIKISGQNSDTIDKFFSTTDSAALFPEYIKRAVNSGISSNENTINNIVASKSYIDAIDYRPIKATFDDTDDYSAVSESGTIPTVPIVSKSNLIALKKYGRMMSASYEAIKFQRLDLFTLTLRQIGSRIAKQHLDDAITTIIGGDGNSNAATGITMASTLKYSELIKLWSYFQDFECNSILLSPTTMAKLLVLDEFVSPTSGLIVQSNGNAKNILGADIFKTNLLATDVIVGLDRNYALEMVCAGDLQIDYDKLIDRQLERATVSSIAGFSKIFDKASNFLAPAED